MKNWYEKGVASGAPPRGWHMARWGWGWPCTKNHEKNENFSFKWSKSFSSYSLVGWEWDSGDSRNCWARGGWECTPKEQKMTKKWQNPIFVALKLRQWAILLHKNMYITISVPSMNAVLCLGVCEQHNRSASPPQTWQKQKKMAQNGQNPASWPLLKVGWHSGVNSIFRRIEWWYPMHRYLIKVKNLIRQGGGRKGAPMGWHLARWG